MFIIVLTKNYTRYVYETIDYEIETIMEGSSRKKDSCYLNDISYKLFIDGNSKLMRELNGILIANFTNYLFNN